jgi:hypothetical protein
MEMNFFDYLNSINDTKKDIMVDDVSEKQYVPFMVNRGLSYFSDTVLFANEMNRYHHLDKRLQFDFLINSIRKKKRFSKWAKPQEQEAIMIVKAYYDFSNEKARSAASLMSSEQLEVLRTKIYQGGRSRIKQSKH